jgi:hypothetical protein
MVVEDPVGRSDPCPIRRSGPPDGTGDIEARVRVVRIRFCSELYLEPDFFKFKLDPVPERDPDWTVSYEYAALGTTVINRRQAIDGGV